MTGWQKREKTGEIVEETPGTPKALLAAVIGMGILIIAGTITLVWVILHRMNAGPTHPSLPASVPLQEDAQGPVTLPPGTRLLSMARVQDDLLALHVSENGQDKVLLWQVSTHRLRSGLILPTPSTP
ncbi:hypothetical protein AD948_01585 [Acetobacter senegalensis]|uniref:Uncharacterized protein n=1 Tax=Acetobacter senegalensis TaxID=446692 RepID=A0A149U7P9_9PROT|nr:hypothetical protein [Acetobacter senegalensis]KXV61458.1 hypothetical protein AD948_01585 [Acetobacter senegalensis]